MLFLSIPEVQRQFSQTAVEIIMNHNISDQTETITNRVEPYAFGAFTTTF